MQVGFVGANIVRPEKLRQPHDFAGGYGIRPYNAFLNVSIIEILIEEYHYVRHSLCP